MLKRKKKTPAKTAGRKKAAPKRKRSAPRVRKAPAMTKAAIEAAAPIVVKLPIELKPHGSWEHGQEAAAAREHTKTGNERATIRATSSGNWTNRQRGKG